MIICIHQDSQYEIRVSILQFLQKIFKEQHTISTTRVDIQV